jgi:hypothetical protein
MSAPRSPPNGPPERPSSANHRVVTATRAAPLPAEKRPVAERLRSGSANLGLNAVAVLKEAWADFRSSDRYFKYKALTIASWVVLSAGGLVVACPGQTGALFANNDLGGRAVVHREPDRTVLLVRNEGKKPWHDVIVIVNHRYRAAKGTVAAHDMFTLIPKQLLGEGNAVAPNDLTIRDVELRTSRGHATLLEDGEAP